MVVVVVVLLLLLLLLLLLVGSSVRQSLRAPLLFDGVRRIWGRTHAYTRRQQGVRRATEACVASHRRVSGQQQKCLWQATEVRLWGQKGVSDGQQRCVWLGREVSGWPAHKAVKQ